MKPTETTVTASIRYPNGATRSVIDVVKDNGRGFKTYSQRCRDANGKTYRVNDETATRVLREFEALCAAGHAERV